MQWPISGGLGAASAPRSRPTIGACVGSGQASAEMSRWIHAIVAPVRSAPPQGFFRRTGSRPSQKIDDLGTRVEKRHPLLDSVIDLTLERQRDLLRRGAVLVDERDTGTEPRVLFYLEHAIQDAGLTRQGERRIVSKRMLYVELAADGSTRHLHYAPYLTGAATITVTRNEILYSLNKPDDFILAIAEFLGDDSHRVHYLRQPFQREADFGVTSVNYDFAELTARAEEPR